MTREGISLGWNCSAAQDGLRLGLRNTKNNGYNTCPFDMMVSNYVGLCECINDDFKYFCDPQFLELRKAPQMNGYIPNQIDDQMWVYNTYYNFVFNHESPFHGNLYLNEQWSSPNHFVENNFEKFIERYNNRIDHFRNYLINTNHIDFILWRYNSVPTELVNIIKKKYPNLQFVINTIVDFGPNTVNCLTNKTSEFSKEYEIAYLKYMKISELEHPKEFARYYEKSVVTDFMDHENIKLIIPKNYHELNQ